MKLVHTLDELREITDAWHNAGEVIGVTPTMGALHEGHLSLVRAAKAGSDRVITTIFVNPTQFNNADDLDKYPRTLDSDMAQLAPFGVDVIYAPGVDQMYPDGFSTTISISGVSEGLCGAKRPGHFDGVATIVAKLFLQTSADRAFFGEKDFQQLQVVKRLAADLNIPVEITGCPTVREADGLALSSRNVRLTENGRKIAPALYAAMQAAGVAIKQGTPVHEALSEAERDILAAGFAEVEYLELRAENGLAPLGTHSEPARLLAAAWLDGVRLIDNIAV
ncbi:pantoate--beta-alanine ligase [Actibacterium sp. XHP0104]|uniref:pantoate--beta-alanine ligase n=1 Tax=Actibacterium sp. XHP0104 TaxID=2984335 RepID=UPI0021E8F89D|nr:pantoate--beta-alanine ligase [Actibacterium sp. XHP0104]MCV2882309.1 pantoate--beta-alanine ligase [Actibacterium sp. XHP0104]